MSTIMSNQVEAVRTFNRFYTQRIGVLREGLLNSPYSLAQARVLYELSQRNKPTASQIGAELALDAGYLSRILRGFRKQGLVDSKASHYDGRQTLLWLTGKGKAAAAELNTRSGQEIAALLDPLTSDDRARLLAALETVQSVLSGAGTEPQHAYILRTHRPGDMGAIVRLHGELYAREYGWDETFEALAAEIAAKFIAHYNPKRERCWVAERNGEVVGSVFLVEKSKSTAKLRLLIVDPRARGMGIGARLVEECIGFARETGYRRVTLWTQSILIAARHIYVKAGFELKKEKPHHSFGKDLVAQTWELEL